MINFFHGHQGHTVNLTLNSAFLRFIPTNVQKENIYKEIVQDGWLCHFDTYLPDAVIFMAAGGDIGSPCNLDSSLIHVGRDDAVVGRRRAGGGAVAVVAFKEQLRGRARSEPKQRIPNKCQQSQTRKAQEGRVCSSTVPPDAVGY